MSDKKKSKTGSIDLILIAGFVTLLVTLVRFYGEYDGGYAKALFNSDAGGPLAIVGITWLPIVFGFLFGRRLAAQGKAPSKPGFALLLCLTGLVLLMGGAMFAMSQYKGDDLRDMLQYLQLAGPALTVLAFLGWPAAFFVNLVYAVLARVPVIAIQYIAIHYNLGTHYEKVPPALGDMSAADRAHGLMMMQATFWVPFTILCGGLFASLAVLRANKKKK